MDSEATLALLQSQTNAAWLQAWGSVIAILVAAGAVLGQHYLEQRAERVRQRASNDLRRSNFVAMLDAISYAALELNSKVEHSGTVNQAAVWGSEMKVELVGMRQFSRLADGVSSDLFEEFTHWMQWIEVVRAIEYLVDALRAQVEWADTRVGGMVPVETRLIVLLSDRVLSLHAASKTLRDLIAERPAFSRPS